MRKWINTKISWDIETGQVIEREGFWYEGPLALAKGGNSQAEQQQANQQEAMQNQLAAQQLALQAAQMHGVNAAVDPIITSITSGQVPAVLQPLQSALTASYLNQLPQLYSQGVAGLNRALLQRGITGGNNAGGGAFGGMYGALIQGLGQQQQAGATNAAEIMNQNTLNLLGNSLNAKLGLSSQLGSNVGTFNQGASSALGSGVTAAGNADQAQSSWMGPVLGGLAGLGGSAITKWCWVASECYEGGWNDPRTQFVRMRLAVRALEDWRWTALLALYGATGRHVAKLVRRSVWLRSTLRGVFDKFVKKECDYILNQAVHAFEL